MSPPPPDLRQMQQTCDATAMDEVDSGDLRNQTRALLDRVAGGESLCITVHGRPVAELRPVEERPQWMNRERFVRDILSNQADPGLLDDLGVIRV